MRLPSFLFSVHEMHRLDHVSRRLELQPTFDLALSIFNQKEASSLTIPLFACVVFKTCGSFSFFFPLSLLLRCSLRRNELYKVQGSPAKAFGM